MDAIGFLWTEVVVRPLTNGLVFLSAAVGNNFWLAIVLFTILSRLALYPLTMKQLRSTKALQAMQPRIKGIQEKYKNDKTRMNREMMQLYKETGVNPLGCLGPLIIQMPIFIGLFAALRSALADTPEGLVGLSQRLYSWLPMVDEVIPLKERFLWMDLGSPDPTPIMPVLVGGSMWLVQKMSQVRTTDPQQANMNNMTTWLFPIMFGLWTFAFPSGLAVYWVMSNLVSIGLQYRVTGWGALKRQAAPVPAVTAAGAPEGGLPPVSPAPPQTGGLLRRIFLGPPPAPEPYPPAEAIEDEAIAGAEPATAAADEGVARGSPRSDRQERGRGDRKRRPAARRVPRRRGRNRPR